jgi:hypothetical protein
VKEPSFGLLQKLARIEGGRITRQKAMTGDSIELFSTNKQNEFLPGRRNTEYFPWSTSSTCAFPQKKKGRLVDNLVNLNLCAFHAS